MNEMRLAAREMTFGREMTLCVMKCAAARENDGDGPGHPAAADCLPLGEGGTARPPQRRDG